MSLFDRQASVNVGGRKFDYPPFSIEFDQTLKIGKLTTTKAKLYNPAPDTIKKAEGKKQGKTILYPAIQIDAGYSGDIGTCVLGEIMDYKVRKTGPDIILEMTIGDKTNDWANANIMKSYKNMSASKIVNDLMDTVGATGDINLGDDKNYKKFTGKSFREAIKNISKDTDSNFMFQDDKLKMEPSTPTKNRQVLYISPESGLVGKIEKTTKGFEFKTLFFHKLQMGDIVQIEDSNTPKATVKLTEGKKKFSTFGKAECRFKAIEI